MIILFNHYIQSNCQCRREKHQKDAELDWYAVGDSKDCVAVDKDGNGSLQLWQRQLCQFPLASRETSEAIASIYPSPLSLLQVSTIPTVSTHALCSNY